MKIKLWNEFLNLFSGKRKEIKAVPKVAEWWKNSIFYQICPISFADTDNNGLGDLRGIINHLDYLNDGTEKSLGVDAIWLTPFYPSPMYDFGYDVADYTAINPNFGTMADFGLLLQGAHQRGIKVIVDLVFNHTSYLHPWFLESRSSEKNPKRNWYIWKKTRRGKYPNNWLASFGGHAWEWDQKTKSYYLHSFAKEQPDLNFRNPEVRKELLKIMKFWLDKGVDGFRLDVANCYFKDEKFRNDPFCFLGKYPFNWRPFEMLKHIYDRDRPETHGMLKEMRKLIDSYPSKMMVGELFLKAPGSPFFARKYFGHNDELNLIFNFNFMFTEWNAESFKKIIERLEKATPMNSWPCYVFSNHDVGRHISRFKKGKFTLERAKIAACLLLTVRGTPFMYYGEEIGLKRVTIPKDLITDPSGKKYWPIYRGRDGERTPMQWDNTLYAGFSQIKPWMLLNKDYKTNNVKNQEKDPSSLLSIYKKLVWLRKKTKALLYGDIKILPLHPDCLCYFREFEEEKIIIILNCSARKINLETELSREAEILFSTERRNDLLNIKQISLKGYEGLILKVINK